MADDILKKIPLPADLPENWTSGQIIAPTGAEAGLDDQHGYNYLMKQVNNAQKALKALAAQREEDLARIKFWASDDPTSPASFIGGTWERIESRFIMGASDTYPAGSTGGEEAHSLTKDELPEIFGSWVSIVPGQHAINGRSGDVFGYTFDTSYDLPVQSGSYSSNYGWNIRFGGNKVHNNIPPYYSMCIWRRVA